MRFEVGKKYYRVNDDGGIFEFYITSMTRTKIDNNTGFFDQYFSDKTQVIVDSNNNNPRLNLIFDSQEKAIKFLIKSYQEKIKAEGAEEVETPLALQHPQQQQDQ